MATNALVQTRIDADVKQRATVVLETMGLTVSDAVRMLLTRTANEGALPFGTDISSKEHDAWFRSKVQEALESRAPTVVHANVKTHFVKRKSTGRELSR
jgi:DNA-damage-inducible protein J